MGVNEKKLTVSQTYLCNICVGVYLHIYGIIRTRINPLTEDNLVGAGEGMLSPAIVQQCEYNNVDGKSQQLLGKSQQLLFFYSYYFS
ncbi:hypothetical protein UNH65_15430 [Chitinophaga sp. 180180018-2]|nr:hypothetical protein [Chitinophaga sp. 212800010-3]